MRNIFSIEAVSDTVNNSYKLQKNIPIKVDSQCPMEYYIFESAERETLNIVVQPCDDDLVILGHECTEDVLANRADFMCIYLIPGNQAYCYVYDMKKKVAKIDKFLKLVSQLKSTLEYTNDLVSYAAPGTEIINQVGVVTEKFDREDIQNQYNSLVERKSHINESKNLADNKLRQMNLTSNIDKRIAILELLLNGKVKLGTEEYWFDVRLFDEDKNHTFRFNTQGVLT